jgi:hypothetical protein
MLGPPLAPEIADLTARDTPGDRQIDLRRVLFAANNP